MCIRDRADIVSAEKVQRLRWLGHVVRMRSDRGPKMALERKPEGVRRREEWYEGVEGDLWEMGMAGWRRKEEMNEGESLSRTVMSEERNYTFPVGLYFC